MESHPHRRRKKPITLNKIEIGDISNHWRAISSSYSHKKDTYVDVECECGNKGSIRAHIFKNRKSKSCGCISNKPKLSIKELAFNQLFASYKANAKKRKLDFSLSLKQFSELLIKNCAFCNRLPSNIRNTTRGIIKYSGIDRWNNSKGYEENNINACCKQCNFLKGTMSGEEFLEYIQNIIRINDITSGIKENKLNYYYERAIATSKNSHDIHTKVGALLINRETGAVISEGYNGFIRGAKDSMLPTSRPEKYNYIVHAETNLLCNAVRHGTKTDNCVVFCTLSPCTKCLRMLWQSGIKEFFFKDKYKDFDECTSMMDLEVDLIKTGDFFKMLVKAR